MRSPAYKISATRQAVVTHYDPRIAQAIPTATVMSKEGRNYHVVPHRSTETKVLNNLGFTVPAPILHHYDWVNTQPFESQRDTARLLTEHRRAYVLNDMGTGKTRASLYACDYLMDEGDAQRALVVAPLSTLTTVWEREIFSCFPRRRVQTLFGTKKKRLMQLAEDADFYIINHDGLAVIKDELMARDDINVVIIDELAIYRNPRTKRWKVMRDFIAGRDYVWGMTGSPTPQAPTDAYGQAKLLTPGTVPRFFKAFQAETMYQVTQFRWLPRRDANDVVLKAMQPAVRYSREDCIDLPPTTYSTREVELHPEQKKAYKEMWDEFTVILAETLLTGQDFTAANSGVQFSKLLQISGGFIYGPNGVVAQLNDKHRVDALKEVIDETPNKVIVFTPFKHSVKRLYEQLRKHYTAVFIHGDVPKSLRDKAFNMFQYSTDPRVLIAHPQTMAHGLTLTAADTIVWYLPPFSLEVYEQANARITRPSQKNHTHIVHLESTPVERKVYKTLQARGSVQKSLLDMFRSGSQNPLSL